MELIKQQKDWIRDNIVNNPNITPEQYTILFTIYNEVINPQQPEYGRTCGACKNKVITETLNKYNSK